MAEETKKARLCSEIQLFDLCDKDFCKHRDGRYCTKEDVLAKFEAIQEIEDRSPEQYLTEESDDVEASEDMGYDEAYDGDEYGEADEVEDEEDEDL